MHAGQAASLVLAAGEGDFELAAEALRVGMTKQELGACFRVRCHIENFAAAHTGERTSGHVAHGIAASFTRRNTDSRKPAHQARSVFNMNVVKLEVLACGDMKHAVGVFLGHFRQSVELIRRDAAEWNFDALHAWRVPKGFRPLGDFAQRKLLCADAVMPMPIIVTLAVTTPAQTRFRKDLLVELPLPAQEHLRFKDVDFLSEQGIDPVGEFFLPGGHFRTSVKWNSSFFDRSCQHSTLHAG